MGRKSALTNDQWIEIERRHVVDGESINSLAAEFGVNESSIRRKIKPNKTELPNRQNPLQALAQDKVRNEVEAQQIAEQIAELPYAKQQIVETLSRKLLSISHHVAGAAEFGAMTAHRLNGIAHQQLDRLDDANPLDDDSIAALKSIGVYTEIANKASATALNLLAANKEAIKDQNSRQLPPGDISESRRKLLKGVPLESTADAQ